jgi:predicted amidophosphoribosyltransferase
MSTMPVEPTPEAACPLCSAPARPADVRCQECGYALAGVGERPGPISRAVMVWSLIGLAAVYLVTLGVVALTH